MTTSIIPIEHINAVIHVVRGHKVMLDADLAALYQVQVKALNQAVRRNIERFPHDFMFALTSAEVAALRSQNVTLEKSRGAHSKYLPNAFTEQGVAMLSSVLRSPRAVKVNIEIMRAFVTLRQHAMTNDELRTKVLALEKRYDGQFKIVFAAIRRVIEPDKPKRTTGFARKEMG